MDIGGRYRVEGSIGRGGMADVRAGTDLRLQRPVAVKFLLPEMAAREDIRRRFEAEACAAASLSDPHAVAVYDTGEHDGLPYIVMERLPGETLADRIATGPQDPVWVRQVAREVLGALGAAHAAGLVHRDVKPGNILITADNHAKIADFGIAKSLEATDGSLDLTGTGQLLGTPAYLPPERLDGGPATAQSDLYSLGVVLYEALTGQCPFPGETPVATAMAIVAGQYPPLEEVRPGLDPALVSTVQRAMATDPSQRFSSAEAMAAALVARDPTVAMVDDVTLVHAVAPATAVLDHPVLRDTTEVAAPLPGPSEPVVAPPPIGRRRSRVPLAAALAALAFVVLLVAVLNRGDENGPNQPVSAKTETTQRAQPPTTAARSQAPQTTAAPAVTAPARSATTAPAVTGGGDKGKDDDKGKGNAKGKDDD
jgi:serine/threonine protein kinase